MNKQELVKALVKMRASAPDEVALMGAALYPEWAAGKSYAAGNRLQYAGKLYKVIQEHTSSEEWTPDKTPALFTQIDETHAGTLDDPIPYSGNMILESGKYYTQDGVIYRCTRDTGTAVFNDLADLVNIYVEVA